MRDLVPRRGLVDVVEVSVRFEVGFDEVAAGGGGDDFGCAAFEELRYPADVVEVAVRADYVVLAVASGVDGLIVVGFLVVAFEVVAEAGVFIYDIVSLRNWFGFVQSLRWSRNYQVAMRIKNQVDG